MVEFAVIVDGDPKAKDAKGVEREQAFWVLAVDPVGARLLIACDSAGMSDLRWVPIHQCKLGRVATPDQPQMVISVQPSQQPVLVRPELLNGKLRF